MVVFPIICLGGVSENRRTFAANFKTRRNETDSNDFDGNAADVLLFGQ